MALFRRLFYRKPPDRLLEIADRVYVFDCCFSTETMDQFRYKNYMDSIVLQLREQFPDSPLMADNMPVKLNVDPASKLNFEDIDVCWDADQRFTKNFKAEVLFSEFDAESDASTEIGSDADEDEDDCGDEIEVDSADEFFEADEIFSNPDSHDGHKDAETLSISSTDCTPSAEARKISPFSSLELNSDIDGSRQNKPLPFEILNDEEACTSVDTNIMHEDTTRVVSSLESTTDGGRDSSTSSSAIYKDKDDGCSVENSNPRQDRTVDPKQDSIHTDNVLVKEVIILETNSPKDIQMIKEVIISEVTTPKQVLPGDTVEMELGNAVDSSENITLTEADNTEGLDFVLKQDDGDSPIEERVTYVNGTKQEDNSNIEQPSTSDTNVLVIELTNENNRVELPLLGKPHPHSTSDTLILSSAEQKRILFLKERKEFHLHFLLKEVKELHSLLLLEDQKGLQYKMDFKVELHRRRHPLEDMEGHLHLLVEHVEHAELHRRRHPLEDMEGHLHLLTGHVDWLRRRHFREDVKGYLHLCRYFLGHMEELHCRRHFLGDTKGLLHLLRYLLEHMEGLRRRRHLLEVMEGHPHLLPHPVESEEFHLHHRLLED
ncbi:hypothetical protein ACQ4PT_067651 [Festuca glaucescens]